MDVMANLQNDRRVKIRMDDMNQRSFEEWKILDAFAVSAKLEGTRFLVFNDDICNLGSGAISWSPLVLYTVIF
jgi:hypothetical protein